MDTQKFPPISSSEIELILIALNFLRENRSSLEFINVDFLDCVSEKFTRFKIDCF